MEITALLNRSTDAWIVQVAEIEGAFALASTLDEVPSVAARAAETVLSRPLEVVRVRVKHGG